MKNLFNSFALIVIPCVAMAQQDNYPRMDVLASSSEMASINYACNKPVAKAGEYKKIECDISYQVLRNQKKTQVPRKEIEDEFKKKGFPGDICKMYGKNIAGMTIEEVRVEAERQEEPLNDFNRMIISEMTPILQEMCREKSLDSFLKFVKFSQEIESNTCEIESKKIRETFTELPQKKDNRSLWVSEGNSLPPCGKKEIIKFVPLGSNSWAVHFENIILNKQAKTDSGGACKDLEGDRNLFNSHNNVWILPCKYIKVANKAAWQGPFNPK